MSAATAHLPPPENRVETTAPDSTQASAPRTPDGVIQKQTQLVEALQSSPYLRGFNPRHYALYDVRHYRPRDYLDGIGIEKIGELIQHGFSFGEICQLLDISVRVMRTWISANPRAWQELDEAMRFAAHEERQQAKNVLYDIRGFPDTARAKAIADLHLWTAERWNKDMYGTKQVKVESTNKNAVSYEFNINVNNKVATPEGKAALEGIFEHVANALPDPIKEVPQALTVFEIPVHMRPSLDFTQDD